MWSMAAHNVAQIVALGVMVARAEHALFFTLRAFTLFGGALRAGAFALFFGP